MRIALLPLDERPVNTRHPAMIAAIAGAELCLPPTNLLSQLRMPADCAALADWLSAEFSSLDALVVDLEMLVFGGLIASRTTNDSIALAIGRLDLLRALRAQYPQVQILGFNVITRISNADNNIEEPLYWDTDGTRLYRFSQLSDRLAQGEPVAEELAILRAEIPAAHLGDFLWRRHRNHILNLTALHMAADGVFDLLVLSSDDTSPHGLGTREKRWLTEMADRLSLQDVPEPQTTNSAHTRSATHPGSAERFYQLDLFDELPARSGDSFTQSAASGASIATPRLLMYPGADEVGCALLARLLNAASGHSPRIAVLYDDLEGAEITAPYEDGPARITVERQIRAVGGTLATLDEADLLLAVATPVPRRSEWEPDYAEQERSMRLPQLQRLTDQIVHWSATKPVVVADIAYPNGADPVFFELLQHQVDLTRLAGYGAWNTAGNTLGTALAQGCATLQATTPERQEAAQRFLLHHYLEDWGYQQIVRPAAREWLQETTGTAEPTSATLAATITWIEQRLNQLLNQLPGFAGQWQVINTHLPWQRLFEVDFELERPS